MKQTEGGITVDRGHRKASAGGSSSRRSGTRNVPDAQGTLGLKVYGEHLWGLPGLGESGPRCGEYYPESVCETCGEPDFATRSCGRRECPDCMGQWAKNAAVKRTVRLQARRLNEPDDYRRQAGHAVVSFDDAAQSVGEVKRHRKRAGEIAQEHGYRGCDVVFHAFRLTDEADAMYERADPDVGKWVWFKRHHPERLTLDHADPLVYWSPHYHVIGLMSPDMDEGDGDGYVYHFIDSFGSLSGKCDRDSHEEVYGTYRYLLSHAGVHDGEEINATVGYGDLSNARFGEFRLDGSEMDTLEKEVEEAVSRDDAETGEPSDDNRDCPQDGCDGYLIDVFDVHQYLRTADPPPGVQAKMELALDWRLGNVTPKGGARRPQTLEEARESWKLITGEA